jgi:hypothetical protein
MLPWRHPGRLEENMNPLHYLNELLTGQVLTRQTGYFLNLCEKLTPLP